MRALVFLLGAMTAYGEPSKAVSVFGTVGVVRGAEDEGALGTAAAYGGTVTLPLAARWAVDVQVLGSRLIDRPEFRVRRLQVSPALVYRRGSEKAHWFIGGGAGFQQDRTTGTFPAFDSGGQSRAVVLDNTNPGPTLHWRTGGVFHATDRMLVRGEFFWVNRYLLPDVGAAVSVGVRLGR
ncbi:MAG: hypothetical protein JNM66_04940 [Bryobacterales bacterium]|nr:hypothetical protein [Bryobacterales bacterium]